MSKSALIDAFSRQISYLRISVTDRCNFRCVYCMAEDMTFKPREQILSLEEIAFIAKNFVALGVNKLRITGGEPLIRNNILWLFQELGQLEGLDELLVTTNGAKLKELASGLREAGVNRINISIDTLQTQRFRKLTRTGELDTVLAGIDAAKQAGFDKIKLNSVILKGRNDDEIIDLIDFADNNGLDISFIEEMPLGVISEHNRAEAYCSSDEIKTRIEQRYPLQALDIKTGGPASYYRRMNTSASGTPTASRNKIGFISPHSHNFCGDCNRVRLTAEGKLLLCLGNEHAVDLKARIRTNPNNDQALQQSLIDAMQLKPERHHFDLDEAPQILRFMNSSGG
jgi:cyclic pyranopterin phosphate synthase